ncbi:MAG TPA: phosphorylase [Pseudolabrys sp.]|nr:phosphorylase [Pseudolabrys sp.]
MLSQGGVVAVTSLAVEARIARGPGVSVVLGNQSSQLGARLEAAIARGASGVISFGIAGGLTPGLSAGDCIVASGVRSGKDVIATDHAWAQNLLEAIPGAIHAEVVGVDTLLMDPLEKSRVHALTGAVAVDMESHIAAKVAFAHRMPFAACRIIIDAAHRTLPPAAAVGLRQDGTPDVLAVCRSLLQNPSQLRDLICTALDARIAGRALRSARKQLGVGLGCPDYNNFALDLAVV